ncbi:MAG: acetolactate synthase large subunit [Betaproteobacteria bacterium]|nr:acetolactate synthase large subunit [Betaproteobacteria bacterium]
MTNIANISRPICMLAAAITTAESNMTLAEPPPHRLGANAVVDTLVEIGVETFFMNPGTSEIHLVAAIDVNPRAKPVLCLFEGAATGAADGFARACGKPAAVLLHLGPGLANGLANMHNARKARSPMVVIMGEHAASHLLFETPLGSDTAPLAAYAAKKVFTLAPGDNIPAVITSAVQACAAAPAGPVVVVANVDAMWSDCAVDNVHAARGALLAPAPKAAQQPVVQAMARALSGGGAAAMVLGGSALSAEGLALADRIAQRTGCQLFCETFNARHARGAGIPAVERIPYFREMAAQKLQPYGTVILAGSHPPVSFFATPGERSELTAPGTAVLSFEDDDSAVLGLRRLADELGAASSQPPLPRVRSALPTGKLNARAVWAALNNLLPRGAIVSDESGVSSVGCDDAMQGAEAHEWFNLTGGSIGQAIPVATGAALARPEARVVAMQGDGGAMYTLQALWTQARERLDVVNVILRNDRYAILDHEVKRHGIPPLSPKGARMFDLSDPAIDWLSMAAAFGVTARAAATAEEFSECLKEAMGRKGPSLIEARLAAPRRTE